MNGPLTTPRRAPLFLVALVALIPLLVASAFAAREPVDGSLARRGSRAVDSRMPQEAPQQVAESGTAEIQRVTVHGRILDQRGDPAAGVSVRIANELPHRESFEATTDVNGSFRLEGVDLTEVVTLALTWNDFHEPVAPYEVPRDALVTGEFEVALNAVLVTVSGSVVVTGGSGDTTSESPMPGALVDALVGSDEIFLGTSDDDGRFEVGGMPLATFGDLRRGRIRVTLPDLVTLAGRFEPGTSMTLQIDLESGRGDGPIDVGTLRFRRLTNPDSEVELGGRAVVRDSIEPERSALIDGLEVQEVVVWINDEIRGPITDFERQGERYTVRLPARMQAADVVAVAVRIDGLLTGFSGFSTVDGDER